jgi:hypothetical protein
MNGAPAAAAIARILRARVLSDLTHLYTSLAATREIRYADFQSSSYRFVPPSYLDK